MRVAGMMRCEMLQNRTARLGLLLLLAAVAAPPAALMAAEVCMGENCLPAQDDPMTECDGQQCADPAPPAAGPEVECEGEDCFPKAKGPVDDCSGEDCILAPAVEEPSPG